MYTGIPFLFYRPKKVKYHKNPRVLNDGTVIRVRREVSTSEEESEESEVEEESEKSEEPATEDEGEEAKLEAEPEDPLDIEEKSLTLSEKCHQLSNKLVYGHNSIFASGTAMSHTVLVTDYPSWRFPQNVKIVTFAQK